LEFDEGFLSAVTGKDLLCALGQHLNGTDKRILVALADGWGVWEIAAKLKVSHAFVAKRRRRIADLAMKLGINPLPAPGRFRFRSP
jgi:hypothetical protein